MLGPNNGMLMIILNGIERLQLSEWRRPGNSFTIILNGIESSHTDF